MKILKQHITMTLILYVIVYFLYSFIVWEFKNPFEWIINMPIYESSSRFLILCAWVIYHSGSIFIFKYIKEIKLIYKN
jgi:hypothetical protein